MEIITVTTRFRDDVVYILVFGKEEEKGRKFEEVSNSMETAGGVRWG